MTRRRRTVHALRIPSPEERDQRTQYSINSGLGLRPDEWWQYDSDRPDLAGRAGLDPYAHMDGCPEADRARGRFGYLLAHDLLTASEREAILAGTGRRYEWRQRMLAEGAPCR